MEAFLQIEKIYNLYRTRKLFNEKLFVLPPFYQLTFSM